MRLGFSDQFSFGQVAAIARPLGGREGGREGKMLTSSRSYDMHVHVYIMYFSYDCNTQQCYLLHVVQGNQNGVGSRAIHGNVLVRSFLLL